MPVATASAVSTNPQPRSGGLARNAAALVLGELSGIIGTVGMLEPARTARNLANTLKPNVFQAPKENDTIIQQELGEAETMISRLEDTIKLLEHMATGDAD
ncbi:hypothetical protein FRC09_006336 [Ceratobasidium sp. 395]|nr:hypothetical protein FRC09_006336 [Ceratobasidium sp. 395]